MATPIFKQGDLVNVYRQSGVIHCSGIISTVNSFKEYVSYNVDFIQPNDNRISTFKCVSETRIKPSEFTNPEALEFVEKLKQAITYYGSQIGKYAYYVLAGFAGDKANDSFYCYCGKGKGYNNASVAPASNNAVAFKTKEKAAAALHGKYFNGREELIDLQPITVDEYYAYLQKRTKKALLGCISMLIKN